MSFEEILEELECPQCGASDFEPNGSFDIVCRNCDAEYELFELIDID